MPGMDKWRIDSWNCLPPGNSTHTKREYPGMHGAGDVFIYIGYLHILHQKTRRSMCLIQIRLRLDIPTVDSCPAAPSIFVNFYPKMKLYP